MRCPRTWRTATQWVPALRRKGRSARLRNRALFSRPAEAAPVSLCLSASFRLVAFEAASVVEAFATWLLARVLRSFRSTAGGIGVLDLSH